MASLEQERIIVGMTGRLSSAVTAYLLKKQGYDVIGINIVLIDDPQLSSIFGDFFSEPVEKIKAQCDQLGVKFYAVNATDLFKDQILDSMISRRCEGTTFALEVHVTNLMMKILAEKADQLGVEKIASGHFAKILKSNRTQRSSVVVANDLENDQSYQLALLNEGLLNTLVLPLAEMRLKEVVKIGMTISSHFPERETDSESIKAHEEYSKVLEKQIPISLRTEGSLFRFNDDSILGDHTGTHQYYIGQQKVSPKDGGKKIDSDLQIIRIFPRRGTILLISPDKLKYSHCLLYKVNHSSTLDISHPIKAYVQMASGQEKVACKVFYKARGIIFIEFETPLERLIARDEYYVIYDRNAPGARIICSGEVLQPGMIHEQEYREFPLKDSEIEEEEEAPKEKLPELRF